MGLITMLIRRLRMLLRRICVLLAFCMISLAVMLGSHPMGLSCVLVVLGGFVVLVTWHLDLSLSLVVRPKPHSDLGPEIVNVPCSYDNCCWTLPTSMPIPCRGSTVETG